MLVSSHLCWCVFAPLVAGKACSMIPATVSPCRPSIGCRRPAPYPCFPLFLARVGRPDCPTRISYDGWQGRLINHTPHCPRMAPTPPQRRDNHPSGIIISAVLFLLCLRAPFYCLKAWSIRSVHKTRPVPPGRWDDTGPGGRLRHHSCRL